MLSFHSAVLRPAAIKYVVWCKTSNWCEPETSLNIQGFFKSDCYVLLNFLKFRNYSFAHFDLNALFILPLSVIKPIKNEHLFEGVRVS